MNILSEKKLENAVVELEIEIPVDRVEIEYKAVFNKLQKSAKIDGFRQGKAPLALVETRYKDYAAGEVAENLVKSSFYDAVEKKELSPIVEPKIVYESIAREESFKYKATFEVMPVIELGDYTGIDSEEKSCNITDEDVQGEIETVRERSAQREIVQDPDAVVAKGNFITYNIKRTDDKSSEELEKTEFSELQILVGKSKDEYSIDKHLIGMKQNEEKSITTSYPADYHIKDFAGKDVTYLIVVTRIETLILPDLTDEFAIISGYQSVEDMKTKTREYLEKYVNDRVSAEVRNNLMSKIVEKSTYDIPGSMIHTEMYSLFRRTMQRIGYNAENIDQFAAALGIDADEYREKLKEEAVRSIKNTLTLAEIAKKEDLKASEEKYQEIISGISAQMGKTVQEVEAMVEENNRKESIEHDIILDKAMDVIYEKANIKKLSAVSLEEFIKSSRNQ